MKPIVIAVQDGKVTLPLAEFRSLLDKAYWAGYRDNSGATTNLATTISRDDSRWWDHQITCGPVYEECSKSTANTQSTGG